MPSADSKYYFSLRVRAARCKQKRERIASLRELVEGLIKSTTGPPGSNWNNGLTERAAIPDAPHRRAAQSQLCVCRFPFEMLRDGQKKSSDLMLKNSTAQQHPPFVCLYRHSEEVHIGSFCQFLVSLKPFKGAVCVIEQHLMVRKGSAKQCPWRPMNHRADLHFTRPIT